MNFRYDYDFIYTKHPGWSSESLWRNFRKLIFAETVLIQQNCFTYHESRFEVAPHHSFVFVFGSDQCSASYTDWWTFLFRIVSGSIQTSSWNHRHVWVCDALFLRCCSVYSRGNGTHIVQKVPRYSLQSTEDSLQKSGSNGVQTLELETLAATNQRLEFLSWHWCGSAGHQTGLRWDKNGCESDHKPTAMWWNSPH